MEAGISGFNDQSTIQSTLTAKEKGAVAPASEETKESAAGAKESAVSSGDSVSISDIGKELSLKMKMGSGGSDSGSSGTAQLSVDELTVDDLQQELRQKNTEVAAVKEEITNLQREVASDPSKQADLSKKENELRDLEDEADKIKAEVYA